MPAYVKINLPTLETYREVFSSDLRFKENAHIRDLLEQWEMILSRFLTGRYYQYSQGGGDWAPLAASTLEYKERKGLLLEILRATDLLFESFAVEFDKPSGVQEFGIKAEFGGGTGNTYPGESITAEEVGLFHQEGGGRLPQRKIIVPPDEATIEAMRQAVQNTLMDMYRANT